MRKKPGRPKNRHRPVPITVTGTPKVAAYLDDLVLEEGYGNSRAEVARTLIWRGIEELISKGVLDRRSGH
jgi:hypothetical protein